MAVAVGASVTALAVFAMAARTTTPIAELLPDAAYYRGHGSNTVNVLLVDIRAWDTMGEISVLLVAATGVASMVFRHRRFGAAPRVADAGQPDIGQIPMIPTSPAVGDDGLLLGLGAGVSVAAGSGLAPSVNTLAQAAPVPATEVSNPSLRSR